MFGNAILFAVLSVVSHICRLTWLMITEVPGSPPLSANPPPACQTLKRGLPIEELFASGGKDSFACPKPILGEFVPSPLQTQQGH